MKPRIKNPFEYEAANNLSDEEILDFYIEDFNYSRFIQSTRNIFLIGERGSGKTMALLFNSFKVQYKRAKIEKENVSYGKIGIHIPCNRPLFHKREHLLLEDNFKESLVAEHYLVLSIAFAIAETLAEIPEIVTSSKKINKQLKSEIEYLLGVKLHKTDSFFEAIKKFVDKENILTQQKINRLESNEFYENALSFSSLVMPLIKCIKKIPILQNSHFMLMVDDAHDLNKYQIRALNSWIAYRDHSDFSFKVASAKVNRPEFVTSTGGAILEGHDFTSVDMEKPFQNKDSEFGKMAREIVKRRLQKSGIDISLENFFPTNPEFLKDLEKCKLKVKKEAEEKYKSSKQINDHIYKYARAEYFRQRSSKSNRPPYSGIETIIDISTGVIRNLLNPCYWMYDAELSNLSGAKKLVTLIPHATQNAIILELSQKLWGRLEAGLDKHVEDCSAKQAEQIKNLFDNLMVLFRERLLRHKSEPRAIAFTISQKSGDYALLIERIKPLLEMSQKAQLLYTRTGSAKDDGKLDTYFVPNRLLLPARGLDPHGQYARVSLKIKDILAAAEENKKFPFTEEELVEAQGVLF